MSEANDKIEKLVTPEQWGKLLRLRGFLAFYVVLHHARNIHWPRMRELPVEAGAWVKNLCLFVNVAGQWGLFAVLAFFVISGFSIAGAYPKVSCVSQFWLSRFKRLYPALVFSIAVSAFLYALRSSGWETQWMNLLATLTFQNEITFGDSFAGNGPYWSLACEVWYYAIYPIVVCLTAGRKLFLLIGSVVLSSYLLYQKGAGDAAVYFSIWLMGVQVARKLRCEMGDLEKWMALFLALFGMLWYAWLDYTKVHVYPELNVHWTVLVASTGLAGLISALCKSSQGLPARNIRDFLGEISYSLYLVHYPVMQFVDWLSPRDSNVLACMARSGGALVLSLSVACVSWRFFEKPFLRKRVSN